MKFIEEYNFEHRKMEAKRIIDKYPEFIPIICEKNSVVLSACPNIDKKKYLVPKHFTMGQFIYIIRKRLNLSSEKSLFLFVNNQMVSSTTILSEIYKLYKNNDGFLYFTYSLENVFG